MRNPALLLAFGAHLRSLRQQRGWSLQVLADTANIAKLTVYRIETAQHAVTLDVLGSLAHAFELPLKALLDFPQADAA